MTGPGRYQSPCEEWRQQDWPDSAFCGRCEFSFAQHQGRRQSGGTPQREDEKALWAALLAGEKPRDAGVRLGIHTRRVEYLCNKWADKGLYEWGVVHDLGWPTANASGSQ